MSFMNGVSNSFLDSFVILFIDHIFVYLRSEEENIDHLLIVLGVLGNQKNICKIFQVRFSVEIG